MVVLRHREAAQVAHHEERVRVDRVGVEEVVLHAPDDAAEGRDVAAEHAVEVHAPELVRDAERRAQDVEEQPVMARVLAELLVDEPQVRGRPGGSSAARTPRICGFCCISRKSSSSAEGLRANTSSWRDLEVVVADLEALVERHRLGARRQDRLAEELQQHLVQQAHVHHRAVVALHELLDRERVARVLVAEQLARAGSGGRTAAGPRAGPVSMCSAKRTFHRNACAVLSLRTRCASGSRARRGPRACRCRSAASPPSRWSGCRAARRGST